MRIISKFHDFYDAVMKTGMDREVVYVRERKEIELPTQVGIDFSTQESGNYHKANLIYLGYCGQILKIIDLDYEIKDPSNLVTGRSSHRKVFFDFEDFKNFMLVYGIGSKRDFDGTRYWPSKYQKFCDLDTTLMLELFHEYQTPLFTIAHTHSYRREKSKTTMTLGPSLKDLDFFKFKDAFTTYQDIFQFVSGTLNKPENKMVQIEDKYKIAKHGFDKWSFRKQSTKKK